MCKTAKELLIGFMRAFDLTGKVKTKIPKAHFIRNDFDAMKADWKAVGDSVRSVSRKYPEQKKQLRFGS